MNSKKLTTMAMLTAISMIVFLIEAQIPLPIAIWTLGWKEAGAILIVRVVLGNLIIGNVMGMLYSLAGGVLCWLIMALLKPHMGRNQIWLMSIFGALGHNAGQLAVAVWVSGTVSMLWYAPVLLLAAVVTGFFTGQCTQALLNHMDKLRSRL